MPLIPVALGVVGELSEQLELADREEQRAPIDERGVLCGPDLQAARIHIPTVHGNEASPR